MYRNTFQFTRLHQLFHLQKKKNDANKLEAQMKIRIIPTRDNDSEPWLLDVWLFYRYIEFAVTYIFTFFFSIKSFVSSFIRYINYFYNYFWSPFLYGILFISYKRVSQNCRHL